VIYCVIPQHLVAELHEPLREFFWTNPEVQVVPERRRGERRSRAHRGWAAPREDEAGRRTVRRPEDRRTRDRRRARSALPPPLPPIAQPYRNELLFLERDQPAGRGEEDAESDRLILQAQAGHDDAVGELYLRHYEPLYSYVKVLVRDAHEAEDVVQDVFARILRVLPTYEVRPDQPFRLLLYQIARNRSIDLFRKRQRVDLKPVPALEREREAEGVGDAAATVERLSDTELAADLRRLPEKQLQVLLLRYMLDFTPNEVAEVVGTTVEGARALQYRGLQQLRKIAVERRE
jgi:RNA polymerase sigma-70 factor, ECF subfamily